MLREVMIVVVSVICAWTNDHLLLYVLHPRLSKHIPVATRSSSKRLLVFVLAEVQRLGPTLECHVHLEVADTGK